jgi:TolB-like protein
VAVLPFTVPEGQSAYGPLAKGLAEMVMTDLSQIKDLKTVERIRVQALVDEMNLGQTGLIEPSSAARFGKLLSAGRVVRGDLSMGTKNKIKLDAVTLDAIRNKTTSPVTVADVFERLFRIEKELVFKVLNQLDIDPTPQERQRIMMVPTRNLQAFMAYCSGLDLEDKGAFEQAVAQYQKALDLDPDFSLAKEKMKVSRILARFNVQVKKSGSIASRSEGREVFGFDREILLSNRLHTIRANIGSKFFLGKDVRKPYQEMSETEIPTGGENLPLPPAPPQPVP